MPKVVLLGSDEIALPAFRAVKSLPGVTVAAVYSQPDRPSGRGQEIRPNPVAVWARAEGLPLLQPERLGPDDAASLASLGADLGVVMAYGQLLNDDFLAATARGFVNFHGSLLPSLRGATPVEAAIALGLPLTGVTLQQVVRRLDAGPVHARASLSVGPEDGRASLRERIGVLAGEMAPSSLPAVLAGASSPVAQDESAVSHTRRLAKTDSAMDFTVPSRVLACRVRALEGWPGSVFEHRGDGEGRFGQGGRRRRRARPGAGGGSIRRACRVRRGRLARDPDAAAGRPHARRRGFPARSSFRPGRAHRFAPHASVGVRHSLPARGPGVSA